MDGKGNIYIFGTFNPATTAHVQMGIVAKQSVIKERDVVYVPTNDKFISGWKNYKSSDILAGSIRASLLEEAVGQHGFKVSRVEIDEVVDGKTFNTIDYLGWDDAVLCIGSDKVSELNKWYRYEELLSRCHVIVFNRTAIDTDGMELLCSLCNKITLILTGYGLEGVSSTQVRQMYKQHDMEGLKRVVPPNVYKYLEVTKNVYI